MDAARRARLLTALAWLTLMASPAWARGIPGSGLAGSPHDFTKGGHSVYQGERDTHMCNFCHVRNGSSTVGRSPWTASWNASEAVAGSPGPGALGSLPLWSQELSAVYCRMYESGAGAPRRGAKASQAIDIGMTPGSTSLVCLGCHDGSVAVNLYGNSTSVIGKGNYLGNHHPVGFDYDFVASMDREIRPADMAYLTGTTTVRDHLYGPGKTRMECGTCHSVHNTGNSGEALLWRSDVRSSLCLTCHDKGTCQGIP